MGEWRYISNIVVLGTGCIQLHIPAALPTSTHFTAGCMGPIVGLEAVGKRKILSLQGVES
jgi:hypothetical protein